MNDQIPFNNLERWRKLKGIIQQTPELYFNLQKIVKSQSCYLMEEGSPKPDFSEFAGYVGGGLSRGTYSIMRSTVELDGRKIFLAIKIPADIDFFRNYARYKSESLLDDPRKRKLQPELELLNDEARRFESFAASCDGEDDEDVFVPHVTGIVAGYGLLATLTEDITEGGTCRVGSGFYGAKTVKKEYPDGRIVHVYCDLKIGAFEETETDYFLERLQIDRPLK